MPEAVDVFSPWFLYLACNQHEPVLKGAMDSRFRGNDGKRESSESGHDSARFLQTPENGRALALMMG